MALIAGIGSVALWVVLAATRGSAPDSGAARLRDDVSRVAVPLAWIVALAATLGSLYYSELAHFVPCKLCWYQRIAMYPLVLLLGIATFRRDHGIRIYVIAQAAAGALISAYHTWIQAFPPAEGTSFCTIDAPCTERYVWQFGFVSLPFMALCGFVAIITLMFIARPTSPADAPETL